MAKQLFEEPSEQSILAKLATLPLQTTDFSSTKYYFAVMVRQRQEIGQIETKIFNRVS